MELAIHDYDRLNMRIYGLHEGNIAAASYLNKPVDDTLGEIKQIMKTAGWKYDGVRRQSAMMELTWSKDGTIISIDGWHGKGPYGDTKLIFNVWTVTPNEGIKKQLEDPELQRHMRFLGGQATADLYKINAYLTVHLPKVLGIIRKLANQSA